MPTLSLDFLQRLDVLLLAGRAAFLIFSFVLAAIAFTRWRRAAERDSAAATANAQSILDRLVAIEAALAGQESRSAALAEHFERHLHSASPAGSGANYRVAIRLARSGAPREELMSGCGLSQQEAELVARLHGPKRAAQREPAAA